MLGLHFSRQDLLDVATRIFSYGMWDSSSLTRDLVPSPALGTKSLNLWTSREVPKLISF